MQFLTKEAIHILQTEYPSLQDFECNGQVYSLFLDDVDSKRLQKSFSAPHYLGTAAATNTAASDGATVAVQALIRVLESRLLFLACAESCTGGGIATLISSIPGSSKVFWGSLVIYSNDAKVKLLGLDPSDIQHYGSVSPECSRMLREAVAQKSNAACTLAITGVAGTEKLGDIDPGTVYIAIASPKQSFIYYCSIEGNRSDVRCNAVQCSVFLLYEQLILSDIPIGERKFNKTLIKSCKIH